MKKLLNRFLMLSVLGVVPWSTHGALLYWSGDGVSQGGAGSWTTVAGTLRWGTAAVGPFSSAWVNANNDDADFGATAGAVTLTTPITVRQITGIASYQMHGSTANTLTFAAGGSVSIASGSMGLNGKYAGSWTKLGAGTVALNNSNAGTSKYIVKGGALSIAAPNRITGGADQAEFFFLDGGELNFNTTVNSAIPRSVTLGAAGGSLRPTSTTIYLTMLNPIHGTAGGNLTLSGSLATILANTGNDWNGNLINSRPMYLGASEVIPNTATVQLNTSGTLDMRNNYVTSVPITAGGSGYTSAPTVAFSGGGGSGAAGTAVLASGAVSRIDLTALGSGYTSAPTVTLTGGGGTGATAGTPVITAGPTTETISVLLLNGGTATGPSTSTLIAGSYDLRSGSATTVVLGGAGAAVKTTSGSVDLTGGNTFTGGFTHNLGTVRVNNNTALGAANNSVTLANGVTLSTTTTTARTLTYDFDITGDIILGQASGGTASLTLAGSVNLGGATRTIQIDNTADTISGVITNGGLTKTGAGNLTLSGNNSYAGPTTVSSGNLILTGANNCPGDMTVSPGAKLLTTTASTGAGNYIISDVAAMTLTTSPTVSLAMNNFSVGSSSTLEFDFNRAGYPNPRAINAAADLTVNGPVTVDMKGFDTTNTTTLIEYAGSRIGGGTFNIGTLPPRISGTIDELTPNKVIFNATSGDTLIWVGDGAGNWDVNSGNPIWRLAVAGGLTDYRENAVQGDTVRFDDTLTGSATININATVTPFNVTVDTLNHYIFNGVAGIAGTGALTKNGSGQLTITAPNTYSGGTVFNAGTLNVGNNSALGTGKLTINGNVLIRSDGATARTLSVATDLGADITLGDALNIGDLTLQTGAWTLKNGPRQINVDTINATINSAIGQDVAGRSLTKSGSGILNLGGTSTFTGGFNHNIGTVRVNANAALGAANSPVTLANGVTLATTTTTARTLTYAFTMDGDLILGQATGGTAALTLAGAVNLTGGNRTFSISNATDTISAVITNGGVIKNGPGILALSGNNSYAGDTTFNEGLVSINGTVVTPFGNGAGTLNWVGGGITVTGDRGTTANNIVNPINLAGDFELQAQTTTGTRNLVFGGLLGGSLGTLNIHNIETTNGAATFDVRFTNAFNFARPIALTVDTVGNNAQLSAWNRSDLGDQTYTGVISGNGSIRRSITTANTGGKVTFTAANTYSGGTFLNDGEIALGSDCAGPANAPTSGPVGVGTVTMANDAGKLSASGAARTLKNHLAFSATGKNLTLMGANDLELSGTVDLAAQLASITNVNSGVSLISGVISNGAFIKEGTRPLILSANNTYTGGTFVNAGTLVVNGLLSSTNVTVNAGGTLGGNGQVPKVVATAGGSVGAGASPGTLTITNGLDLSAGGTNVWELSVNSTNNPGTDFDQIVLSGGNLTLGGTSRLLLKFIGSATFPDSSNAFWQTAHQWKVIALTGSAVNTGATTFAGVDGVEGNNAGTFSTSADGSGNIILQFVPGFLPPPPVIDPKIVGAGTPTAVVSWSSVAGASYTVQYKTNILQLGWITLTNLIASGPTTSIADTTVPVPVERYYRVMSP